MTDYEIYVFILCLIVFVLLTVLSAISLTAIVRMYKKLIRCGEEDEKLIKEYQKLNSGSKAGDVFASIVNILLCLVFVAALGFSLYINSQDESVSDTIPTFRVVESESMSEKYSGNTYLTENGLDNQFDMFDLILTYKLPDEFDLQLYDIVVYQYKDYYIIHRIIAIEEPNEDHPDSRLFTLRGDANQYSDAFKVEYSQMKGIYYGERVRFLGSFILFMQSPAGWLCVFLLVGVVILTPALESHIGKRKYRRLVEIGVIKDYKLLYEIDKEKIDSKKANYVVPPVTAEAGNVQAPTAGTMPQYADVDGSGFYDLVRLYPDNTYEPIEGGQANTAKRRKKK